MDEKAMESFRREMDNVSKVKSCSMRFFAKRYSTKNEKKKKIKKKVKNGKSKILKYKMEK